MQSISDQVTKKINEYGPQDLSNTAWAYAKLGIVHYTMLGSISADVIKKISQFTPQNLANTAWAWATLAVHDVPLLQAITIEAVAKRAEFTAQNFGNTAWAFAAFTVEDAPLMQAISQQAMQKMEQYDLQALTWLADFDLSCQKELAKRLGQEVLDVWRNFPSDSWASSGPDAAFLRYIRQLGIDNLGAVGDRLLFEQMGVHEAPSGLGHRARLVIAEHCVEDPREAPDETTFGGPSRHKRVFSYAEYQLSFSSNQTDLEGAILQENGARGAHFETSPLHPVQLPINQRVERNACSEYLLLSDLCGLIQEAALPERRHSDLSGTLRLYSTGPSCMSCMTAIWQFHLRYPSVRLEVGYSTVRAPMQDHPTVKLRATTAANCTDEDDWDLED
mmetsp:Transcript_81887/g.144557  ORF Transcript_81887/g.144557 Transcript_81887/m.144557 type:complete len:390 (+) Transcript_81887:145-1314(+)